MRSPSTTETFYCHQFAQTVMTKKEHPRLFSLFPSLLSRLQRAPSKSRQATYSHQRRQPTLPSADRHLPRRDTHLRAPRQANGPCRSLRSPAKQQDEEAPTAVTREEGMNVSKRWSRMDNQRRMDLLVRTILCVGGKPGGIIRRGQSAYGGVQNVSTFWHRAQYGSMCSAFASINRVAPSHMLSALRRRVAPTGHWAS